MAEQCAQWQLVDELKPLVGSFVFVVQEGQERILAMGNLLDISNGSIEIEGHDRYYEMELSSTEVNMRVEGATIILKELNW